MKNVDSLELLGKIRDPSKIKEAFAIIEKEHGFKHTSQIPIIINYLDKIAVSGSEKDFIIRLLKSEERIFWTIDDSIDYSYSYTENKATLEYYNEVVKFVSFLSLMDQVLDYQIKNKKDFSALLFNKKMFSQRLLSHIYDNLFYLIELPYNEKIISEKILAENNSKLLVGLVVKNQLNRAQNIRIYLATVEAVANKLIPKDAFLLVRTLQLIREDLQDLEPDKLRGTNNIIWLLEQKFKSQEKTKKTILLAIEYIKKEASGCIGGKLGYMQDIINREEKQILKLI